MTTTLERKTPDPTTRVDYMLPAVNIREEKDAYVLEADLPGVNKDSLEILLEGSELTLIGHRAEDKPAGQVLLREQRQADYRRVFEIDPAIDTQGITAHMQQGLLTLTLPKSEDVKPRKIVVNG
jgi:HSP20 family protein